MRLLGTAAAPAGNPRGGDLDVDVGVWDEPCARSTAGAGRVCLSDTDGERARSDFGAVAERSVFCVGNVALIDTGGRGCRTLKVEDTDRPPPGCDNCGGPPVPTGSGGETNACELCCADAWRADDGLEGASTHERAVASRDTGCDAATTPYWCIPP